MGFAAVLRGLALGDSLRPGPKNGAEGHRHRIARFGHFDSPGQNRFNDCPARFQASRVKNFFPTGWHRQHEIVYVKAVLLKIAGRVSGMVGI
jgi:hypothetical protein